MDTLPERLQQAIDKGFIRVTDLGFENLLSGVCVKCPDPGKIRRMNTAYDNELTNWVCACDPCMEEIQDYWQERWEEYYGGCL